MKSIEQKKKVKRNLLGMFVAICHGMNELIKSIHFMMKRKVITQSIIHQNRITIKSLSSIQQKTKCE